MRSRFFLLALCLLVSGASACSADARPKATPVYDKDGKLEQLHTDTNGDGKPDARAFMNGADVTHAELDRDADGKTDRWEYYASGGGAGRPVLARAEEANGRDGRVTRRETYLDGVISRVEEDTDFDGRTDKWEVYERGALVRMDLDLTGRGRADQRLIYGARGTVERVEVDPDGDGVFVAAPPASGGSEPSETGR